MSGDTVTEEELRQIIAALRGHAKWLRNYAENPGKYFNPIPMAPDELDRIAERLSTIGALDSPPPERVGGQR